MQNNRRPRVLFKASRSLSPTMVSEYKTQLPDKKLLQEKLHELFEVKHNENEIKNLDFFRLKIKVVR